jgi:DNA-binding transcriptional LysR family regulator
MNNRDRPFDWNHARAFLATLDTGSLSAAARLLGQSQPTIGRQIAALESDLRIVLFEKAGRGLVATPAAFDLAEYVRAMAQAADRAALVAGGYVTEINGPITIACSEVEAVYVLPSIIERLYERHQGITVTIVASNQATDLARREADIGIRSFIAEDPDLIIRKIRDDRVDFYASPALLKRAGPIKSLSDLGGLNFIGLSTQPALMRTLIERGIPVSEENFPIKTSCLITYIALVRQGLGLGMLTQGVAARHPELVRVFDGPPFVEVPLWLASHRDLKTSRRIRIVFDFLVDELSRAIL